MKTTDSAATFGGLIPISASQLSTFKDCPRKWGYDKVECVPRSETPATMDGHLIHAQVEDYFKTGAVPERAEGRALLAHLPSRGEHIIAEHDFQFVWPGVPEALVRGYIDLIDLSDGTVYDHKTSANLSRAVKTVDELRLDAQSILYGAAIRMIRPSDDVKLQWTYVQREAPKTRPPKTQPVKQIQSLSDLEAGLRYWTPVVEQLVQIVSSKTKILDIAPNRQTCYKYGPCQYRELCPDFAGRAKVKEPEVEMSADLMARLAAMSAGTVRPETPPAEIAPQPTDEIAVDPSVKRPHQMPLLDALRIDFGATPDINPPDVQPDVTPLDPPPPAPVEAAPVKPKRGRPAKPKAAVESGVVKDEPAPPWVESAVDAELRRREEARVKERAEYDRIKDAESLKDEQLTLEIEAASTEPIDPVSDFDLDQFVTGVLQRTESESTSFEQTLEAARIAVELMQVRAGKK